MPGGAEDAPLLRVSATLRTMVKTLVPLNVVRFDFRPVTRVPLPFTHKYPSFTSSDMHCLMVGRLMPGSAEFVFRWDLIPMFKST